MAPAKRAALAVGLAVVLLATAASAQDHPAGAFKVRWEPRGAGGVPMIDGLVHNDSPYRVTNVRLQIEGLDAGDRPVGLALAWRSGTSLRAGRARSSRRASRAR